MGVHANGDVRMSIDGGGLRVIATGRGDEREEEQRSHAAILSLLLRLQFFEPLLQLLELLAELVHIATLTESKHFVW